MIKSWISSQFI